MSDINKTVTIETEEEVELIDGNVENGEVIAYRIKIRDMFLDIDEGQKWNDIDEYIENIEDSIEDEVEKSALEVDTYDRDYTVPRFVKEGTIEADILTKIVNLSPTTSRQLDERMEIDHSTSPYISDLKKKGLVAAIGVDNNSHVIVPTHVGIKEVYCMGDLELQNKGLKNLFEE